MKFVQCGVLFFLFMAGACGGGLRVGPSEPKASFDFAVKRGQYILELADEIEADFQIPRRDGIGPVVVRGWRTTLSSGFSNSLGRTSDYFETNASYEADIIALGELGLRFSPNAPNLTTVMHASLDTRGWWHTALLLMYQQHLHNVEPYMRASTFGQYT